MSGTRSILSQKLGLKLAPKALAYVDIIVQTAFHNTLTAVSWVRKTTEFK